MNQSSALLPLNSGASIPQFGFGTYKLTGQDAYDGVCDALELGYRHIDTAQMYGNEAEVGSSGAASTGAGVGGLLVMVWVCAAASRVSAAPWVPTVAGSSGAASTGAVAAASMGAVSAVRAGVPEVAAGEWVAEASSKEESLFDSIRLT